MTYRLAGSQYIVNRNYNELSKAIDAYDKNWLKLMDLKNKRNFDVFLRELNRLLHNYLSSIYSLIEHTEVFRKDLNSLKINVEYKQELTKLNNNKCLKFVQKLRSYTQHKELPFVAAHVSAERENLEAEFEIKHNLVLMKKDLLQWKWKKDVRTYIMQHKEDIDLKMVINEYHALITNFYKWFYKRVIELHSKEFRELKNIESQIKKLEPTL